MNHISKHYFDIHYSQPFKNVMYKKMMIILTLTLFFSTFIILNIDKAYSESKIKGDPTHGVKIDTPKMGDRVSTEFGNLTFRGTSVDDESLNCQVLVIVNDVKPYQKASAAGLKGEDDFSKWTYTLSAGYTKLKSGPNKITAKLDCRDAVNVLKYSTIKITGTNFLDSEQNGMVVNSIGNDSETKSDYNDESMSMVNRSSVPENRINKIIIKDENLSQSEFNVLPSTSELSTTNAQDTYLSKKMNISNNVKYLVILIPNEGHESTNQPKNQLPLINQPYVPQNAVIGKDTSVIWLNADVGHRHKISISDPDSRKIYDGKFFNYDTTSNPVRFNETGTYSYWESNVTKEVPDFIMQGTVTVSPGEQNNTTSSQNKGDIVGTFMVPAIFLDKYRSEFEDKSFTVHSTYTYKDLRGGQKGTGPEQTLMVWQANDAQLENVVLFLKELTASLPYS